MPVLLALCLTAVIGMTGLAVDYGFATIERRALQNAADAAALSGAIDLVSYSRDQVSPSTDVTTIVARNAVTTGATCAYVNASNDVTGDCASPPSDASDGVKVVASNSRATFFLNVVGIPTYTVSAESVARISAWTASTPYEAGNALFIVCGFSTRLYGGGTLSILQGTAPGAAPWDVNPAAIGRDYVIHDPHVADCGMQSNAFKGLNASSGTISLPAVLTSMTGDHAGPTRTAVNGIAGCPAGLSSTSLTNGNACVMLLPIAVSSPAKDLLYSVRWLPFRVWRPGNDPNTHVGRLIGNYTVREETSTLLSPWSHGTKASITSVRTIR